MTHYVSLHFIYLLTYFSFLMLFVGRHEEPESTGYSALPSRPRLMRRAVAARRTHTQRASQYLLRSLRSGEGKKIRSSNRSTFSLVDQPYRDWFQKSRLRIKNQKWPRLVTYLLQRFDAVGVVREKEINIALKNWPVKVKLKSSSSNHLLTYILTERDCKTAVRANFLSYQLVNFRNSLPECVVTADC